MSNWRTDDDMVQIAVNLGYTISDMYEHAGERIPTMGTVVENPRDTLIGGLVAAAEDFMALDPQRIDDEFFRIQRAAQDTGDGGEASAHLVMAQSQIAVNWHGEAAVEFATQMTHINTFMVQQGDRLGIALHALRMMYAISVEARRSYYDLAGATIAACELEMGKQATREAKAMIGLGSELAKALIGTLNSGNPKDLIHNSIDSLISISAKVAEIGLEGSEAGDVVNAYSAAIGQLRHGWESGLWDIRDWMNRQDAELGHGVLFITPCD